MEVAPSEEEIGKLNKENKDKTNTLQKSRGITITTKITHCFNKKIAIPAIPAIKMKKVC